MNRKPQDTHIYFPPEVYDLLKTMAKLNRRTVSAEVVIAVEERIDRQSKKAKDK